MAKYVTGDFAAAKELSAAIKRLGSSGRMEINDRLADASLDLIQQGFQRSRDPEGKSWEALKFRSGKPLIHTGGLANSFDKAGVSRRGFKIRSSWEFVETHQDGKEIEGPGSFPVFGPGGQKSLTDLGGAPVRVNPIGSIAAFRQARAIAHGRKTWISYNRVSIPQRQMVPEGELPELWLQVYERIVGQYLSAKLKNK